MIDYCEYAPSPRLHPYVECFWTLKTPQGGLAARQLIIPGGRAEMIFNFKNPLFWYDSPSSAGVACQPAQLLGQRNRYYFMDNPGVTDLFGVRFRQGGLAAFTGIPVDCFLNQIVPLTDIVGPVAQGWAHRLAEAETNNQRVQAIESLLCSSIRFRAETAVALRLIGVIKQADAPQSVQQLCERTGIHYKKMERLFTRYTGYSPKNFCRVIRFYRTLREMKREPGSLTQLGLQYGYYDQPHFIRDFQQFTGTSPTRFPWQGTTIAQLLLESVHV